MAQVRRKERTNEQRVKIFERDGWICQLCGRPVERGVSVHQSPFAPTIDHIIPLSKGGKDSVANCQTAHYICNLRKGRDLPKRRKYRGRKHKKLSPQEEGQQENTDEEGDHDADQNPSVRH